MIKKGVFAVILSVLILSFASAEIVVSQQPKELYNMGDVIEIPIKIVTATEINNFFSMNLICNGIETEVYKEYIKLQAGQEKKIDSLIPLVTSLVGRTTGVCKIKSILGAEYSLTNEFEISDGIDIRILTEETAFNPGKDIQIEGEAIKANGQPVKGVVEFKIIEANSTIAEVLESVKNGYFFINFSLPPTTKAGKYTANLDVYERDFEGQITNRGFASISFEIRQIPSNLEIFFENQEVEPGTNLKVKAILHDQTGEKIQSIVQLNVKNEKSEVIEKKDLSTDEFLEVQITSNQAPAEWEVIASSGNLTAESSFKIKTKESVKVEIINATLIATNTGNVPYNKTLVVKIGNKTLDINMSLDVEEVKKYVMKAPEGEYQIEVLTKEGEKFTGITTLTGRSVEIKEYSRVDSIVRHPFIWIFIIGIFGVIAFIIFKKGYQKNFFGYIPNIPRNFKKKVGEKIKPETPAFNITEKSGERAELSLSIKGEKQNASIVYIKVKNPSVLKKQVVKETLEKIKEITGKTKSAIYENQEDISFILAPVKTKTFENEKMAIDIAQEIKGILAEHNRLYKDKIEFGLAINSGSIIVKQEKNLKFTSLGTFISAAKKISSLSNEEILLSEEVNKKILSNARTERQNINGFNVYRIKEMKNNEEYKKFINGFMKRMDKK